MPCFGDGFNRAQFSRQNSTTKKEWTPRSSLVRGNAERMRFQNQSDNLAGGLQYWCKQKRHKTTKINAGKSSQTTVTKILSRAPSEKCHCDGFVSREEGRHRRTAHFTSVNKCAFQSQYCDVLGPCAECSLSHQRMNIVQKHNFEFPGIEVSPRMLVAPSLAEVMLGADKRTAAGNEPGRSVLELPSISPDTRRYMRREAGSTKQKRKTCIPHQDQTNKKYIEIRLPKI